MLLMTICPRISGGARYAGYALTLVWLGCSGKISRPDVQPPSSLRGDLAFFGKDLGVDFDSVVAGNDRDLASSVDSQSNDGPARDTVTPRDAGTDRAATDSARDVALAPIFSDVPATHWAFAEIQAIGQQGISAGCGDGRFCPTATVPRAQAAPMILRASHGAAYTPPRAVGNVFVDVSTKTPFAAWIEQLSREGITGGCGQDRYCPSDDLTRGHAAALVLRAALGTSYSPPAATGTVFADVAAGYPGAAWIERLAQFAIGGCGGGNFCPDQGITRAAFAVFVAKAFGLD